MTQDEVEYVAQALYDAQECARGWRREPEILKERFRREARATIETLGLDREIITSRDIAPLVLEGDIRGARDFLMNSPDVSVLSVPSFRAFRTVLRGPDLRMDAGNDRFFKLVGRQDFNGLPVRAAFPELGPQGYHELLDHVRQTRKPFVGSAMLILFQPKKDAPLEEHITDVVYRPIEDAAGQVAGLFVEGYDRTEWARA
jgi:hypothetical protein